MTKDNEINGVIYCATCTVNGKKYIGKTTRVMWRRKSRHLTDSRCGSDLHFHRAIRKYGESTFTWEILVDGVTDEKLLSDLEIRYIENFNSFDNGYNSTSGGDGGGWGEGNSFYGKHHSEESIQKMRQVKIGKKASMSTKLKMSNSGLGKTHTAESIDKMIRNSPTRGLIGLNHPASKSVVGIPTKSDDILFFDSMTIAEEMLNAKGIKAYYQHIGACCKGKRKSHAGYNWMYKEEYEKLEKEA